MTGQLTGSMLIGVTVEISSNDFKEVRFWVLYNYLKNY